jgi:Plasmid pRiA4b ORF-3-like protein
MSTATPPLEVYRLHVWLREISPMIWRRLLVRSDSTVADLHYTLQIAMGWEGYHLHQFIIRGKRYGVPQPGGMRFSDDPTQVRLADLRLRLRERFLYEYDFGDLWQHEIRVEQKLPVQPKRRYPTCIGGQRAAPPEDCGGPWAFMALQDEYSPYSMLERLTEMLEAIEAGDLDAIEDVREAWAELHYWMNREQFDRWTVNRRLQQYAVGDEAWQWR